MLYIALFFKLKVSSTTVEIANEQILLFTHEVQIYLHTVVDGVMPDVYTSTYKYPFLGLPELIN